MAKPNISQETYAFLIGLLYQLEGAGFDPRDKGSKHKFGLSSRTHPAVNEPDFRFEDAAPIIDRYIIDSRFADIAQLCDGDISLAGQVFSVSFNIGPARAIKLLQDTLNGAVLTLPKATRVVSKDSLRKNIPSALHRGLAFLTSAITDETPSSFEQEDVFVDDTLATMTTVQLKVDGKFGPKTMELLSRMYRDYGSALLPLYTQTVIGWYRAHGDATGQKYFINGWINRVSIKYLAYLENPVESIREMANLILAWDAETKKLIDPRDRGWRDGS